jgi:hypothetical protein
VLAILRLPRPGEGRPRPRGWPLGARLDAQAGCAEPINSSFWRKRSMLPEPQSSNLLVFSCSGWEQHLSESCGQRRSCHMGMMAQAISDEAWVDCATAMSSRNAKRQAGV